MIEFDGDIKKRVEKLHKSIHAQVDIANKRFISVENKYASLKSDFNAEIKHMMREVREYKIVTDKQIITLHEAIQNFNKNIHILIDRVNAIKKRKSNKISKKGINQ